MTHTKTLSTTAIAFALLFLATAFTSCERCYGSEPKADVKKTLNLKLLAAIIQVESGGDSQAHNRDENAVGLLQIRPIMVAECNRILKKQGSPVRYTIDDRWTPERSIEMFWIFQRYWNPEMDAETAARMWQGGPAFKRTPRNNAYWQLIKEKL